MIRSLDQLALQGCLTILDREVEAVNDSQMVDPHSRLDGDLHVVARHHGGQRRAAVDPQGPGRELHRPAVGGRRLRADARRAGAHGGVRWPTASGAGGCSSSGWGSSRRRRCLRAGARRDLPEPRARGAGHRRRGDVRGVAGAHRAGVPGRPRARHGHGHVRRDDRRGRRDRPARRRGADRRRSAGSRSSTSTCPSGWRRSPSPPAGAREPRPQRHAASTGPGWSRSAWRCSCSSLRSCAATTRAGAAR